MSDYVCRKILNHIKPDQLLSPIDERALTLETLEKISTDKPRKDFEEPIAFENGRKDYLEITVEFIHRLSGDEFIGTVIPPQCIPLHQDFLGKWRGMKIVLKQLGILQKYNCQIADLFWISSDAGKVAEMITCLLYLIDNVEGAHCKTPTY